MRQGLRKAIHFAPWAADTRGVHYGVRRIGLIPYRNPRRTWTDTDWLAFLFSPHYRADPDAF